MLRAQHRVRVLAARVAAVASPSSRCARAAARGDWMPIVRDAARHNRISAAGLRRLMSLESGGRAHAENGSYHGLYQYCWSTWRAAWNPWRGASLYNGEAQIRATALAIHRGWGAKHVAQHLPARLLRSAAADAGARGGGGRRAARAAAPPPFDARSAGPSSCS